MLTLSIVQHPDQLFEAILDIHSLHQQALREINQGQFAAAHRCLVSIIEQQAEHADAYFLLGIVNSELGQFNKAVLLIQKAIAFTQETQQDNTPSEYWVYLAKCLSIIGDHKQAFAAVSHCDDKDKLSDKHLDTLGVVLSRLGMHKEALSYFEQALKIVERPSAQLYYNYAVSLKFSGDFAAAARYFDSAISLQPNFYQALFARSDLKQTAGIDERIQGLKEQWDAVQNSTSPMAIEANLHIGHALAIEYQQKKEYAAAFTVLAKAKEQRCQTLNYTPAQDASIFSAAKQAELKNSSKAHSLQRPIFVLGMPRSGTTLMERILSGHTQVGSGGELQDFGVVLKELTQSPGNLVLDPATLNQASNVDGKALGDRYLDKTKIIAPHDPRFVDKLPFNFFYLTLIQQALPGAKMLCMLRNPMDTCLGNYRQLFSIHSPYYQYAYKLDWLGEFYAQFYHYVNALAERLPNLMIVNYEALVDNPEQALHDVLAHCELPFEAACIAVENNTLPVSTASKVQVREPINSQSIGRWRNFEQELEPLASVLRAHKVPF